MRLERPRSKRADTFAVVVTPLELRKLFHIVNRSEEKAGAQYPTGRPDGLDRFGEALAGMLAPDVLG